ncbi:MAG: glycosyltransferase family 2 protein [Actinomycetota bacterium]
MPRVSVIVPVRDRRALLRRCLDALAAQTFTDVEVIVVDDGSTDGSGEEAIAHAAGRPARVVATPGIGAVAARLRGVEVASGEILAFTDSDCRPVPGWIEAGVREIDEGADVVQGLTRPDGPVRPLERTLASPHDDGLFPTCNVFYRRSAYDAAGGFDPGAGDWLGFRPGSRLRALGFGEDTLLGWRVRRAGKAAFAPDAIVEHHVFRVDVIDSLRRAWATGAFPALIREVPEVRPLLNQRFERRRRARIPCYVTVAATVTRSRRLVMVSAAWWIASRWIDISRREPSMRRRLKVLPADLAIEGTTAASLVLGSVRARTVWL